MDTGADKVLPPITADAALRLGWEASQAGTWHIRRTVWPCATWAGVTFHTEEEALGEIERRAAGDLHITVDELRERLRERGVV